MRLAMLAPIGVFVVILGVVGIRLVALSRQSRELPELALGAGLLLIAFVGMPLAALGRIPATVGSPAGHAAFAVGIVVVTLGLALLYVFNWRVFRADSWKARIFVAAAGVSLLAVGCASAWQGAQASTIEEILARTRVWSLALMELVALQFAWAATESLLYHRAMRRRLALGLADPVDVNRFLLWGLASAAGAMLCGGLALCVLAGMTLMVDPLPLNLIALTGAVCSVSWFLTFFPPEAYQRFLRRSAAQA